MPPTSRKKVMMNRPPACILNFCHLLNSFSRYRISCMTEPEYLASSRNLSGTVTIVGITASVRFLRVWCRRPSAIQASDTAIEVSR